MAFMVCHAMKEGTEMTLPFICLSVFGVKQMSCNERVDLSMYFVLL